MPFADCNAKIKGEFFSLFFPTKIKKICLFSNSLLFLKVWIKIK